MPCLRRGEASSVQARTAAFRHDQQCMPAYAPAAPPILPPPTCLLHTLSYVKYTTHRHIAGLVDQPQRQAQYTSVLRVLQDEQVLLQDMEAALSDIKASGMPPASNRASLVRRCCCCFCCFCLVAALAGCECSPT